MAELQQSGLLGLDFQELTSLVQKYGQPDYRARQLFQAIYPQRVGSLESISTLPKQFRSALKAEGFEIRQPAIQKRFDSVDGTIRYLMTMADGETVETVWMPEGDGGEAGDGSEAGDSIDTSIGSSWSEQLTRGRELRESLSIGSSGHRVIGSSDPTPPRATAARVGNPSQPKNEPRISNRATICVSSQVGCAVNCQFCLTALLGIKRNLEAGEIVGQVAAVLNDRGVDLERQRVNIVFMGMGEPFLNYANFMKSVRLLNEGVGLPESRMTVSTSGIVPRIYDFGNEAVRPKLAISLNAPNDELRNRVMPINRKYNLGLLMQAAREFPLRNRERITFEYVLLNGVNDGPAHAREVTELVRGIRCKLNLIALNPGPGIEFSTPEERRVQAFQNLLMQADIPAFVRRPRGRDIYAACGQLKLTS